LPSGVTENGGNRRSHTTRLAAISPLQISFDPIESRCPRKEKNRKEKREKRKEKREKIAISV
jgi:hypothetical protein